MPPITIVSVTSADDARLSVLQALSVDRLYPVDEIAEYLLILNDPDPEWMRSFLVTGLRPRISAELWKKMRFLSPVDVAEAEELLEPAGQRSQQVLELAVAQTVTTEHYWLIDPRTHLVSAMDTGSLWNGDRIRLHTEHGRGDWAPCLAASMEALRLSSPEVWAERPIPVATPLLLIRSEVLTLIGKLRERSEDPFSSVFLHSRGGPTALLLYYVHLRQEYGENIPYSPAPPLCARLSVSCPQEESVIDEVMASTGSGGTPMFGLHRADLSRLTAAGRQAIDSLWHQRLLTSRENSSWFLENPPHTSADVSRDVPQDRDDQLRELQSRVDDLEKSVRRLQPKTSAWIPPTASVGNDCNLAGDVILISREEAPIIIGDATRIYRGAEILGPVTIGSNVLINRDAYIRPHVTVEDDVFIGPFVRLITDSHEIGGPELRAGKNISDSIKVGRGTWVGASTTVLGGVSIGEGCVVAAGSLVAQDVPPNTLYGGVPAKLIRHLDHEGSKTVAEARHSGVTASHGTSCARIDSSAVRNAPVPRFGSDVVKRPKHVIVTMSRGDAPRLAEWIAYHRALGFDEFHVILDNPNDNSAEILESLGDGIVVDVRAPQGHYLSNVANAQTDSVMQQWCAEHADALGGWGLPIVDPISLRQYQHLPGVLNKYAVRGNCWVAVIDVDEFLVVPGRRVQDITAAAEHPRVRFLNFNFDTTDWFPGEPVLSTCTDRWHREDVVAFGHGWQDRHKSIVRHDALFPFVSVHGISRGSFSVLDPDTARLHHYKALDAGIGLPYRVPDSAAAQRISPDLG